MEGRLFRLAWWWTDKRFPITADPVVNQPATSTDIGADTRKEEIAITPWEEWKKSDISVVEEKPKKKKAAKTTKKKTKKV